MNDKTAPDTASAVPTRAPGAAVDSASPEHAHDLQAIVRRLGPAGPLALISVILPPIGGFLLLAFTGTVGQWLKGHQDYGVLLYIGGFWIFSGFSLLPTYAQAVVGGWAFGMQIGYLAALAGFVGGALIGYTIGRFVTGTRALRIIDEERKWRAVYDALLGSGFWRTLGLIALVRLNSPFSLINFFFGAMRTNLVAYILGTAIGLTPRTAAVIYIAQSIKDLTGKPGSPRWLIIASIVAAIVIILIIGKLANDAVERVTRGDTKPVAS